MGKFANQKNGTYIIEGLGMENFCYLLWSFGIFKTIWCILWPFGKFCCRLVYIISFWYGIRRIIWQPCPNTWPDFTGSAKAVS
jgi:hypothetical protein